jgi:hypothetical protein
LTLRRGGWGAALAAARTPATETATAFRGSATTFTFRLRRAWLARGLWLLRLNGRRCLRGGFCATTTTASAATAATTISAARLLFTGGLLLRRLSDDCCFIARRTLIALLVTLFATFSRLLLLAARLLRTSFRPRRSRAGTTIFLRHAASRPLLELLHFLLHELAALRLEFRAQWVVAAVGAALPSIRM